MKKRVYCLYRVSTKGQVEKDDIPMQRQSCRKFAEEKGWEIVEEFTEKGVSGFKVSAKDRDAIQEIQRAAALKKFDVLLVFMFDRLGRKEDETPFVVEWFARNGIEVWSTVEGQQSFDNHVDKLMNYIRYWQASGESLKTSVRTKTRLGQIVQEGRFRGGVAPYGYRLVKKGRVGKKNREKYEIEVNEDEAIAVREMFDLSERFGYGGRRISTELREKGIINLRTGDPFHYSSIQNMLRNIMYTGVLRSGDSRSEVIEELQIITPQQFERVESCREQRSSDYAKKCEAAWGIDSREMNENDTSDRETRNAPRRNVGKTLLSGNIFCGHCGGRMFATTAKKTHHPEYPERVPVYKCYNRTQHKEMCDGQSVYRAQKVDGIVEELIRSIFEKAREVSVADLVDVQVQTTSVQHQQQLKRVKAEYAKATKEQEKWESLMLDSIEGTCVFTPEQVKKRLDSVQANIDSLAEQIGQLQLKMTESKELADRIAREHRKLLSWAEIYDDATLPERKMIASQIIKAVQLSRGYEINVEFNISEAQYLEGMGM